MYDWDVSVAAVARQDALGQLECSVGELVAALGGKVSPPRARRHRTYWRDCCEMMRTLDYCLTSPQ